MTDPSIDSSASALTSATNDELSSKMSKTHISPPERFRRRTIKDDLRVPYQGPDIDKKGKKGRSTELEGNMFRIVTKPDISIYMYTVQFEPQIRNPMYRIKLMNQGKFGDPQFYNGNVLFLPFEQQSEPIKHTIERNNGGPVEVTCTFKSKLQKNSNDLYNMLGSFVKRCISDMDLVPINNGLYLMDSKTQIEDYNLDVVSGYKTTVLPHEDDLMLTVNLSNKVMARGTVLDLMNDTMRKMGPKNKDALLRQLVGKIVITKYNNKTYKVDDISFEDTPMSTFDLRQKDGTKKATTFVEYFEAMHNVRIRDTHQPLLISRKKREKHMRNAKAAAMQTDTTVVDEISLVPELCYLTGIPDEYLTDFRFKKAMMNQIKSDPRSRRKALDLFTNNFKSGNTYKVFDKWGFLLDNRPVAIPARIIDPYTVEFGGGERSSTERLIDFRGKHLYDTSIPIRRWVIIHPASANHEANDFRNLMNKVCQGLGLNLGAPKMFTYQGDRDPRGIGNVLAQIKSLGAKADMIVLLQRNQNKDIYDYFKKETCLSMGVPSQVVLLKHFRNQKGLLSVITKIAIQIACKVGLGAWAIKFPPKDPFMIIGMDTYHDSNQKGLSCCAAVASLNNSFTQYAWSTAMLQSGQEINTHMRSLFQDLIQSFVEFHQGLKPSRIIIFRDGVGEGQVAQINDYEFSAMQQCISEVSPQAKLACLTISKRIETRFFDRGQNPKAGTIVDQIATHSGLKDFYLVPLESRQGTVTPIHYRIHFNNFNLSIDNFQYLAYLLCHMYFNWPGPIKIPAVCQYAHKCAFLVGTSLHSNPHMDLKTRLFFL